MKTTIVMSYNNGHSVSLGAATERAVLDPLGIVDISKPSIVVEKHTKCRSRVSFACLLDSQEMRQACHA